MSKSEEGRGRDVVDVLIADHRELQELFGQLERSQGTPDERRRLVDVVIAELVRHFVAEEEHIYPTVRKVLPDADQAADHKISEHAQAERTMKRLEQLDRLDPRYNELIMQLITAMRRHISDEEADLFPRLRTACPSEQLAQLAGKVEEAKRTAPTRAHPYAPDRSPANKVVAAGAGLVDRMRDALNRRPTTSQDLPKETR